MAEVVIGTAGHVDHGKTELIRALTGQDTDRLPEEKRRGISIDLGFAEFQLPGGRRAGIVDVPGHERFIKNMVAGATGIDLALLVVAADEGVMPQTREHLDILHLLGVSEGLIVLTKIDLVDGDWLDLVEEEVREAVRGTFLEDAGVVRVSSRTGAGLDRLRQAIDDLLPRVRSRPEDAHPRLPIDRVFTVAGFGTVVTGTLAAGRITADDRLQVQPGDLDVRVRQIQVHGRRVDEAVAGQRVALNLVGASTEDLHRGQVLVAPGSLEAVRLLAAVLHLLPGAERPLRSGARVRLHTGTSEVLGRVLLLDRHELAPGDRTYVVFRAEEPLVAARGDAYIIRTYSPMHTVGGGRILDVGRRYRRFRPETMETLAVLEGGSFEDVLDLSLRRAGGPVSAQAAAAELNVPLSRVETALKDLERAGRVIALGDAGVAVAVPVYRRLAEAAVSALDAYHRAEPLRSGMPREELRAEVAPGADAKTFADLLARLEAEGCLERDGDVVRRPGFRPRLDARQEQALSALRRAFKAAGASPPAPDEALRAAGLSPAEGRHLLDLLTQQGDLVRVAEGFYLDAEAYRRMITAVCTLIHRDGPRTVAEIRDHLGTSRKYVVPFLEHLDARKLTRRSGDRRDLTPRGREAAAGGDDAV